MTEHESPPLLASLRQLGASFLGLIHTRLSLASIELDEEIRRLVSSLVVAVAMLVFAVLGLLVFTMMIVLTVGSRNPVLALGILTVIYLLLSFACLLWLRKLFAERPPLLQATLAELEKDRAALTGREGLDEAMTGASAAAYTHESGSRARRESGAAAASASGTDSGGRP
jgi:uncharacterized membrane protein YqjE